MVGGRNRRAQAMITEAQTAGYDVTKKTMFYQSEITCIIILWTFLWFLYYADSICRSLLL